MKRTALLLPVLILLSPLVVSCGGDEEEAPAPLSKAEFTAQANEICKTGNEELVAAAEDVPAQPSEEEITQFAEDTFIPVLQGQHDDLAALGVPEGDESEVQAILDSLQAAIDAVEEDPSALLSSGDPFKEASDLAGEYGLEECAA